ncbi:hypothetical protein FK220_019920 [Flavobacteriaceae bacterium TP-CH-4]|uniref:Lipoprotein n=1 Tax=Pelagihabitans pacificus TaxID=2696054 RepID=A0A967EFP5_9FLAO|nr:hypothetical protein [Pelagihabitans pacificus]NHF61623.1 hypothetical protein [Pelagihabitans pacificus]
MKTPKIILILVSILFLGCNSSGKNGSKIILKGQVDKLEQIVNSNLNGNSELNPVIALNSIVELYQSNKSSTVESNEKPIDIYVIYGTDYWKDDAKTFEIAFAHQKVDQNDGNLYEYRIDMIYEPSDFKEIAEFDLRHDSTSDLKEFKKSIEESDGFQKALKIKPMKIELIKEQI